MNTFFKYALITGAIAGIFITLSFFLSGSVFGDSRDFGTQEVVGYIGMLLACVIIYSGTKRFRDKFESAGFSFGRGFMFSIVAILIMSLLYAGGWELYSWSQNSEMMTAYFEQQLENIGKLDIPEDQKNMQIQSMKEFSELYFNSTLFRMGMSMLEILPVGIFTSLLTAAVLRIKK